MSNTVSSNLFGNSSKLEAGVLNIDFQKDFGLTPTTPEQCLAILLWKLSESSNQDHLNDKQDSVLSVEYQGRSSTTNLTDENQEILDIFHVLFRKISPAEKFDPTAY